MGHLYHYCPQGSGNRVKREPREVSFKTVCSDHDRTTVLKHSQLGVCRHRIRLIYLATWKKEELTGPTLG